MKPGPTKVRFIIVVAAAIVVGLATVVSHLLPSIQNMPVYIQVPTNPPPAWVAVLGSNTNFFASVPYAQATDKQVSELDVDQIKRAIPWMKTVGRFYRPDSIAIESSKEAEALFWRASKPLRVSLTKTDNSWIVKEIHTGGQVDFVKSPSSWGRFWNKVSNALPF